MNDIIPIIFLLILLTEKYFDMKKVQCKEALDIYKKFLTRMTRISEFLKVAEVSQDCRPANQGACHASDSPSKSDLFSSCSKSGLIEGTYQICLR